MATTTSKALADITSQAANAGVNTSEYETANMHVYGTFVATVQVQVSHDNTNWINEGSALTATGKVALPPALFSRCNVTAFTSGTIKSVVMGRDDDRKG